MSRERAHMKLKLISPGQLPFYTPDDNYPQWYPRLGLPILAALTPSEWEVTIIEGRDAEFIDFDEDTDLVGLSVLTPFAFRAYEIADIYRERGVTTILGGVHPSALPDEAKGHADAVVIGEGENVWKQILEDFKQGELGDFYRSNEATRLDELPLPRRDLLDSSKYSNAEMIMPTRGCPVGCGFCLVPWLHGRAYRIRPIEKVLQEINALENHQEKLIIFPENLLGHRIYATRLFEAIEPLGISVSAEGHLPQLRDESYLAAIKRGGCHTIYVETEMVSKRKEAQKLEAYEEAIKKIKDMGIKVIMNFTAGYDEDDRDVFEETVEFIDRNKLTACVVQFLVPWPGTRLFQKMEAEGRIIDRNWAHYDNTGVIFRPRQMSVKELQEGCRHVWAYLNSHRSGDHENPR